MYNRYIPSGGTYTRVVERDEPEAERHSLHPGPPQEESQEHRGQTQQSGQRPHNPQGRGPMGGGSQGNRAGYGRPYGNGPAGRGAVPQGNGPWQGAGGGVLGGLGNLGTLFSGEKGALGGLFSGEKGGLGGLFSGESSGVNGILKALHLEELDSGDILLVLIILFLLIEGDNMDLVITLGLMLLLGLADEKKEKRDAEKQDGP